MPPTRSSSSVVLAEAAVTRDGDQASRGSWLRRISSRPTSPLSSIWRTVYIFHRLEILFARSAAKLSRFEIFMNGSVRGSRAVPPAIEQREFRPRGNMPRREEARDLRALLKFRCRVVATSRRSGTCLMRLRLRVEHFSSDEPSLDVTLLSLKRLVAHPPRILNGNRRR